MRFGRVFQQTYTRFNDLKQAEAQTREAQIEASLERVRAKSMAMHKSEELAELSLELVKQVQALGVATWFCAFNIYDEDPRGSLEWGSNGQGTFAKYRTPREGIFLQYYKAGQRGETLLINEIGENECPAHYDYLCSLPGVGEQLLKMKDAGIPFPTSQIDHVAFFKYGYIIYITYEAVPEAHDIFKRFAKVFEQTYTRFLDLQKAEAQARESQIEAALEKVRSRSIGMQKSEELKEVIQVIHDQLIHLNFKIDAAGFTMDYYQNNDWNVWIANKNQSLPSRIYIPFIDHPQFNYYKGAKEKGLDFFANTLSFEDKNSIFSYMFEFMGDYPQAERDQVLNAPGFAISQAFLKNITLWIYNLDGNPYPEEDNAILMRFAKVFEQTYVRFNDLKQAEEQAREAQIETALERVRSRTMAMHRSDELADTASVLFDKETHRAKMWLTRTDGEVIPGADLVPLTEEEHLQELYNTWKNKKPVYSFSVKGEDRLKWTQYIIEKANMHLPEYQPDTIDTAQIFNEPAFLNSFIFSHGFIMLHTVEAQARESQIEAALERVRAKAMAMHKSDDLSLAVATIFDELDKLDLGMLRCGIGILNKENKSADVWTTTITDHGKTVQVSGDESMDIHPLLQGAYDAWLHQTDFSYVLEGEDLNNYYKALLGVNFKLPDSQSKISEIDGLNQFYYVATFQAGGLFAFRETAFPDEAKIVIKRFADVFNFTYTRFRDLQKAEAHNIIIQAENERKTQELEEARQLQLSMLPKELPKLPNLDIAVYMQTATEVGGDYYDFQVGMDGTLMTVIGDATGHGMKAGTVVTITKSLFNSMVASESILSTFEKISQVLKGMKFRHLAMCLLMIKIKGNRLSISSAAMPPALIYRLKEKSVEEILLKGMPLGSMNKFPYKKIENHLNSGDRVLLYSDGLPELANENNEMYGYDRIKTEFHSVGDKEPEEIVDHLKNSASQWANGKDPDDDVTFVVIKVN
jgi:serine phosphatase RsbU (regulator of sigma subunit)